jgi:predicted dehydrogenase
MVRFMAGGEPAEVHAHRSKFGSPHWNVYGALIRFDNDATGLIEATRASGGRTLGGQLHAATVGCYFDIPSRLALFTNDGQRNDLNGWDLGGVERSDSAAYDGTLDMHRHFIECIRSNTQPLTDIRDTVHTMELVAAIEGEE